MNLQKIKKLGIKSLLLLGVFLAGMSNLQAKAVEGVVNINTATVAELTMLPGVGPAMANQILQIRQSKPFATADDLKTIKGFGPKRLETLTPHIVFTGATTAKSIASAPSAKASAPMGNGAASSATSPSPTPSTVNPTR